MAVFKCKMCGGDLEITEGMSVCECEYCGTKQTVPSADNEKKLALFTRANKLRFGNEFDKAAGVYETIVTEFPEEAEAYWGLVLCKYGIEYVDDPASECKIPTCHRSSFESVMDDPNYEQTLENADAAARTVYRDEAKQIEELRKGIIEVSSKEEPYDVFICYKETDDNGDRTVDSVIAQDVYTALTEKGYRVFFSRITLEDKLGVEYEPYIFAALNSAKIMLAFGTDYEYYNAVWVKNEWSRFLQLIAKGEKKTLIPCYKGIGAYDMPKEFAKLQAQDMGKVGAVQDLMRGIAKILPKNKPSDVLSPTFAPAAPGLKSFLERAYIFLEDGKWNEANSYLDKVLDIDPKNARAYLGKMMIEYGVRRPEGFAALNESYEKNQTYDKIRRFDEELGEVLSKYLVQVNKNIAVMQAKIKETREKSKRADLLIATGFSHVVGVKADGTVIALGSGDKGQCAVQNWKDIIAVAAGEEHTVGLTVYGTAVAAGAGKNGECAVENWRSIKAVSAGKNHTVGLCEDGTVVAVGNNEYGQCNVRQWNNIVAVAAGWNYTVGLRADGTVEAVGQNDCGQCNTRDWRDIIAIAATADHTLGLRENGTVVAAGNRNHNKCDVADWRHITAIAAGGMHSVGLVIDGSVVSVGSNNYAQCSTKDWRKVIAISTGFERTVALCSDGTVLVTGKSEHGEYKANDWKLFESMDALRSPEEKQSRVAAESTEKRKIIAEARKHMLEAQRNVEIKRQQQKDAQAERRQRGVCQYCGGEFKKKLFSKKCVGCGKPKDY